MSSEQHATLLNELVELIVRDARLGNHDPDFLDDEARALILGQAMYEELIQAVIQKVRK